MASILSQIYPRFPNSQWNSEPGRPVGPLRKCGQKLCIVYFAPQENRMSHLYDTVTYPGQPQPAAHPDRLASMATLFGMRSAPIERCRMLELGCGDAAHLVSVAFGLPGSQFVGVDLAETAIARGHKAIETLRLSNVRLIAGDLVNLPANLGQFDYIVAHGLYSWVPQPVRERVLQICHDCLSADGVAYISYNAYPGSHTRQIASQIMRYHTTGMQPIHRPAAARELLQQVCAIAAGDESYRTLLQSEHERVGQQKDGFLLHDDLAAINHPVSIADFLAHAAEHGLQYLADAEYSDMADRCIDARVGETLHRLGGDDPIRREQYLDFIVGRCFRRTLLCRAGTALRRPASVEQLRLLRIASPAKALPGQAPPDAEHYVTPGGASLTTMHPLGKLAMQRLASAWPESIAFLDLLVMIDQALRGPKASASSRPAAATVDAPSSKESAVLGEFLLMAAAAGVVKFHSLAPRFARMPGPFPTASALARWQASEGDMVSTLAHTTVRLEGSLARHLLLLLDGTRNRSALLNDLTKLVEQRQVTLHHAGQPVTSPQLAKDLLTQSLEMQLEMLGKLALLSA